MADHYLVEQVIDWLGDWDGRRADKPVIIDRDDSESASFQGRRVSYDLTDSHVVSVASTPDRQTTAIGTEYDHRVEDAVNVRLEGAHTDEHGSITDSGEWQQIVNEARRVILDDRTSYPVINNQTHYHTVLVDNEATLSANYKDYYRAEFDVTFRGYAEPGCDVLRVPAGETYTIAAGETEVWDRTEIDGTLNVQGTLIVTGNC